MKNLKLLFSFIIIGFLLVNHALSAVKYEFRVLASKGEVQIQRTNSSEWENVTTGYKIFKNDKVKLSPNSYLSLVHATGRTIELSKERVYTVKELIAEISSKKSNLSKRFANYVMNEVGESKDLTEATEHRKNMETPGWVERSLSNGKLLLNSPVKTNILGSETTLSWIKLPGDYKYKFHLLDKNKKNLFSEATFDDKININSSSLKLNKGEYYFWSVTLDTNPDFKTEQACFLFLTDKKSTQINNTLKQLNEELGNLNTAPTQIILAGFYEENNLLIEARDCYREAIKLSPDVDDYKTIYYNFLARQKIDTVQGNE